MTPEEKLSLTKEKLLQILNLAQHKFPDVEITKSTSSIDNILLDIYHYNISVDDLAMLLFYTHAVVN
jgi:hypothetical protein